MHLIKTLSSYFADSPLLFKFAVGMGIIVSAPSLGRLVRLPAMIVLLFLGALLLMFSAGLSIDVRQFRDTMARSMTFGVISAALPLAFGILLGLAFGHALIPAI